MRAHSRYAVLLYPILLSLMVQAEARSAVVQADSQSPPLPYITIGQVEGSPGATLIVPVYYRADSDLSLRSFTVDVEYVSKNLKFQGASGGVVDQEGLEISSSAAKVTADTEDVERSKLRLTVALTGRNSKQGLAEGLLAYLMFDLSLEAKPFIIKLNPTIISAEDTQEPPQEVSSLGAQAGSISVFSQDVVPETGCFFFSH